MSANAQTQLVVTSLSTVSSLYYTSTSGITWSSTLSGTTGLPLATRTIYSAGAVSGDGRVVALAASGDYLYTSNNAGASFTNTNPNTPLIYLPFETVPVNGTTGGTTLTVTGSPTLVTGIVGSSAVNLANTSGGVATKYIRGTWSGSNNYTVSFWFNIQGTILATNTLFITSPNNVILQVGSNGVLQFYSSSGINITTSSGAITTNTWYNVTAIYRASGVCYLYINNVLIGQGTNSGGAYTITAFNLGCYDNANGALNGYIDDFKIYNSVITYPINYNNVAVSNTGQYILASVTGGSLFVSADYGSTWTQITSVSTASTWLSMAVSATGQYMVAVSQTTNNAPVYSTNYGITWNQTTFIGNTGTVVALSGSGQYCLGIWGTTALLISNYLVGLTTTTYSQPTLTGINANISGAAISLTGQYMVIVTSGTTNNVYYSNNYGANFTGLTIGSAFTGCAISADGSYITVTNGTTVYQLNNNSSGFSVAIGNNAGVQNQGQNAIAIGNYAGQINQSANSIILNASGSVINPVTQGFYVAPIAQYTVSVSSTFNLLAYGTDNQIVHSNGAIIINSSGNAIISGNVGIGSTVPQTTLDVNGVIRTTGSVWPTSGSSLELAYSTNTAYIQSYNRTSSAATAMQFLGSSFFFQTGNVGIGTTNPSGLLHLYSTSTTAIPFVMSGTGETYALSSSGKNMYYVAGTLASWYNTYTATTTATLIDIGATPASNGSSNVYFGAVAGPTGNGPANFVIGRRSGVTSWTESVRVDTTGNVGIGTMNPETLFFVKSGSSANSTNQPSGTFAATIYNANNVSGGNGLLVKNNWNANSSIVFEAGQDYVGSTYLSFLRVYGSGVTYMFGNVGIGITNPGYTLHVVGAIYASGDITALSDKRFKQDIVPLQNSLNRITQLTGYSYTRTDTDKKNIGLIAQEVNEVFPEAVSYKNDLYSLNYGCLIAPVIQAMKELKERVDKQDLLIQQLQRLRPE
jgi:hypothetical protein